MYSIPGHAVPDELFRKSSYSHPHGNDCVEVADLSTGSAVRDTQNRSRGHLLFSSSEWSAFVAEIKHLD